MSAVYELQKTDGATGTVVTSEDHFIDVGGIRLLIRNRNGPEGRGQYLDEIGIPAIGSTWSPAERLSFLRGQVVLQRMRWTPERGAPVIVLSPEETKKLELSLNADSDKKFHCGRKVRTHPFTSRKGPNGGYLCDCGLEHFHKSIEDFVDGNA